MVAQTHLDVKLYVHFLSCLFLLLPQTFLHHLFIFSISPQYPESDIELICVYKSMLFVKTVYCSYRLASCP